jgi:hypothetical protein
MASAVVPACPWVKPMLTRLKLIRAFVALAPCPSCNSLLLGCAADPEIARRDPQKLPERSDEPARPVWGIQG